MIHRFSVLCRAASRFVRDDVGSVSSIFAVSLTMLVVCMGVAIDFAIAHDRRSKFDAAADSAALAALRAAKDAFAAGEADWQEVGAEVGMTLFRENKSKGFGAKVKDVSIRFERSENEFKANLIYVGSYPTNIMKIFSIEEVGISNKVEAAIAIANFLDVHLLVDISTSMGIGATPADQAMISAATGCALACHFSHNGGAADNYPVVRATGARLRVDVVRDAVRNFINDLKIKRSGSDQVRLSIDLFDNGLIPLFAPSTDLDAASAAAANIDLVALPNHTGTNISYSLDQLAQKIDVNGDGYAANRRKSFVVLLSDGIENTTYAIPAAAPGLADLIVDPNYRPTVPATKFRSYEFVQTIEASACDSVKAAGHTLLTAHVEYLIPAVSDNRFDYIEANLKDKSIAEFSACASSPAYAFTAGESDEIAPLFDKVLNAIFTPTDLRLTN